jgi:hypothetical protein
MKKLLVAVVAVAISLNAAFFIYRHNDREVEVVVTPTVPNSSPWDNPEAVTPEPEPEEPEPKVAVPTFIQVEKFRNYSGDSVYADVLSHSKDRPYGDAHGRATNVHETAHGIHAYLRNKYRGGQNGFYCLKGRAVLIEEPKMRKSRVAEFVPQNLRSYRFNTYVSGQRAWDSTPLYLYDEWTSYVLGGTANVDDVKNGRYKKGWTDGVSGCLGFSIYAVATCMAVEKYDPDYWENNKQFRNFTIWMLRRAHETFMIGREMEEFKWDKQDRLLNELLTSREAEPMRKFIREHLEGVWLDVQVSLAEYKSHQRADLSDADANKELRRKL